jgi:molybdopterin molybdotransferase
MSELSWWQARGLAAGALDPGPDEEVPLATSLGRTLATEVRAVVDLPGFATAAMDGWVVAGSGPWTVVGTIDTGTPADRDVAEGQAMRIATGGAIPAGATSVIPWELAQVSGDVVTADLPGKSHIRPQGEECVVGDVLARRGDIVNPALLGSLAAAATDTVRVVQRPKVSVLVVGDEVVHAGVPRAGEVRDALGVQIPAWVSALGGDAPSPRHVTDDPAALGSALASSISESDVVVATGGTARGHRDFLRSVLESLGARFLVDGVAVRPGHPMMLADIGGTPVVGLPGNPLSALVAMVTLVEPAIESWFGRGDRELPQVQMAESVSPSTKDLTRLMVGCRELGGFRQVEHVSSAMLRGIAHADGWAVIPAEGVPPGATVPWIPVPWFWSRQN